MKNSRSRIIQNVTPLRSIYTRVLQNKQQLFYRSLLYFPLIAFFLIGIAWISGLWSTPLSAQVRHTKQEAGNIIGERASSLTVIDKFQTDFTVHGMYIKLVERAGKCTLLYNAKNGERRELDMDMIAPCNIVRNSRTGDPRYYTYGKGKDHRSVVLVVGGEPSKEFPHVKDRYMPNGCGTSLTKIYIYDGSVKVAWSGYNGPPSCPTTGFDEIQFAS